MREYVKRDSKQPLIHHASRFMPHFFEYHYHRITRSGWTGSLPRQY